MTDTPKPRPHLSPAGKLAAGRRQERLAAALRANLARRKAQTRERAADPQPAGGPTKPRG
ncbi:MAG: hypothetical protein ACLQJR_27770 [Stellaceae bacterium]